MDLFVRRKISWEAEPETVPAPQAVESLAQKSGKASPVKEVKVVTGYVKTPSGENVAVSEQTVLVDTSGSIVTMIEAKVKNGNGHQKTMIRKLHDGERAVILHEFLKLNGQMTPDAKECSRVRLMLDAVLAVWQVTGYTSVLHRYVAEGQLFVNDLDAYMKWMQVRPGQGLWTQYNAVKFQQSRLLQAEGKLEPSATVHKLLNWNIEGFYVAEGKALAAKLKPLFSVFNKSATLTGG